MDRIYSDSTLQECYEAGFDAGKDGANTNNSNFRLFDNPHRKKAWERGHRKGKAKTPTKKQ